MNGLGPASALPRGACESLDALLDVQGRVRQGLSEALDRVRGSQPQTADKVREAPNASLGSRCSAAITTAQELERMVTELLPLL